MEGKPLVTHIKLHKELVKNAWIIKYEKKKILVIEFLESVTEDESIKYIFALSRSIMENAKMMDEKTMNLVKGTYVRILDEKMQELINSGIRVEMES